MTFEVVKTNIVNVSADAIILPANQHLREGSGTSAAIFKAAGRKNLKDACNKIGYCEVGSAVPTLAFGLNANYIIHAVVPKWIDGSHNEYELLSSAYSTALKIADLLGCESIAFPVLAAGNNGFDLELAVQIAKENFDHFSGEHLKKIFLVVYGDYVAHYVQSLGYNIIIIPENPQLDKYRAERKARTEKIIADSKDVAQSFFTDQIENVLVWLNKKENREIVVQTAIGIVQLVFAKGNKQGKIKIPKKH